MNKKEELLNLLRTDPQKFVTAITENTENVRKKSATAEYKDLKRDVRKNQVGRVQQAKYIGQGEARRRIDPIMIPIPFQNKIVATATAFEVGEDVTIKPSEDGELVDEIQRLWERNRMHGDVRKAVALRKSQLESAVLFYIQDISKQQSFNRIKGVNDKREIKTRVLDNSKGIMTPIYDLDGDMILFCWQFKVKNIEGEHTHYTWVYDEEYQYQLKRDSDVGEYSYSEKTSTPHGFDRIPVAYMSQDNSEWFDVQAMIDRMEVSMSKLGGSNDYAGHPILKLYGEVRGLPDKNADGKAIRITQKETSDGRLIQGDAKFLTYTNAPQSVDLELKRLEKYIHSMSSTPDITFANIKGLGSISGYAIELMFMDAMIKAKGNNTEHNKPFIERCLNILISGIVTTLKTSLQSQAEKVIFDIIFNSILPKDLDRAVQTYMNGVVGGFISVPTAVKNIDVAHDTDEEIEILKQVKALEPDGKTNNINNLPNS